MVIWKLFELFTVLLFECSNPFVVMGIKVHDFNVREVLFYRYGKRFFDDFEKSVWCSSVIILLQPSKLL
jgi:hypothetical protein